MTKNEGSELLKFTLKLAKEAGKILIAYSEKSFSKSLPLIDKGSLGLASEADVKSEKWVMDRIHKKYPKHLILSEEDSFVKKLKLTGPQNDEYMWLIDPLDGTNNFLNGLPFFCVSLALMKGQEVIVGVVYQPLLNETFYALKGRGAYLERYFGKKKVTKKLKASRKTPYLKDCLISTNLGSHRQIKQWPEVRAFRRLGSAALELCYVAGGILDGYWDEQLQPWDMAAGGLICEEAGIKITDLNRQSFHPFQGSILASRPALYEDLFTIIGE